MNFAGHITAIDKKTDDENADDDTVVEVVEFQTDGTVQIAFNDRNERCYLQFRINDLMLAIAEHAGQKISS